MLFIYIRSNYVVNIARDFHKKALGIWHALELSPSHWIYMLKRMPSNLPQYCVMLWQWGAVVQYSATAALQCAALLCIVYPSLPLRTLRAALVKTRSQNVNERRRNFHSFPCRTWKSSRIFGTHPDSRHVRKARRGSFQKLE